VTSKYMYYGLLAGMAISSVLGDWFLVTFARQKGDYRCMILGFLFCNAAVACFLGLLYTKTLFQTSINFDVVTTAALMGISIFVLKEKIPSCGIFWGGAAVFCVYMMQRYMPE